MFMIREREVVENETQLRKIVVQLIKRLGQLAARRTFEITVLFQGDRGVGPSESMDRLASGFSGIPRQLELAWPLVVIEPGPGRNRAQPDRDDNYEWKNSFHP